MDKSKVARFYGPRCIWRRKLHRHFQETWFYRFRMHFTVLGAFLVRLAWP